MHGIFGEWCIFKEIVLNKLHVGLENLERANDTYIQKVYRLKLKMVQPFIQLSIKHPKAPMGLLHSEKIMTPRAGPKTKM